MPDPSIAVIVVAAGRGVRASASGAGVPKQYRPLAGRPVLARTLDAFLGRSEVRWVLPVISPDHQSLYADLKLTHPRLLPPAMGALTRQGSVLAGLEALEAHQPDLVLIQDAARPMVSDEVFDGVLAALEDGVAALPVTAVTDTIKRSRDGRTTDGTEDRRELFAAQTPQGFRFSKILEAHRMATAVPDEFTDDAAIAEWAGFDVILTPGSSRNIKITQPEDFARAERLLEGDRRMETRIGSGYDVHPFAPGDAVWLGGVRIPHHQKLKGHSDADVALHALSDALYGTIGEGDIGQHFPPSDPQWKGARSTVFLAHAAKLVGERGGRIVNVDVTIVAEVPKVGPHAAEMKAVIAETCGISPDRVGIKATTNERLGYVGREEGVFAMASASVELPREAGS
ncbi:bifunctional 2-C-methyl-D-erythritol 4-phosphate cytidylyltransferase/2-C-methyl-D-erythritol 2,4-cyclodiphosphate synthase [Devosia sp.]|uniref:bifunctional 2-C-methyl-D-erythritol 4-phosphate cytidylyltransferase/2-C-methyl-D-erythritol 2,4-cyclodiphosphate synthase n=1 Tax=Devosia sp. TaxID=1871048 RepID=UPI003A8F6AAD